MSVEPLVPRDGVTIWCNTTGWALGPVFATVDHAEDFLAWMRNGAADRHGVQSFAPLGHVDTRDPRCFLPHDLERLSLMWAIEQTDQDGELKRLRLVS